MHIYLSTINKTGHISGTNILMTKQRGLI